VTLCVTVQVKSFEGYYPCISSQLGEKFTLLRYNQDIIDLFNSFGIHMYIVYYVWLFKFNHLKHITPHNLVRNLHCYVTTRTSLTFSIYLVSMYFVCNRWRCVTDGLFKFNNLMDITPVYHHNFVRNLHCYVTTPTSSTFSIYLGSICI
jgi:hypothetical protein